MGAHPPVDFGRFDEYSLVYDDRLKYAGRSGIGIGL